jgi:RecA-family ATPase
MIEKRVDVLTVDPFISSHAVSENDNNAIDVVAREWNVVAERTGAAINLVHHVRKQNGAEATADSARGASALIGKARSVIVYNRMTADEAIALNVPEDERRFFSGSTTTRPTWLRPTRRTGIA